VSADCLVVSELFGPTFQGEGPSAGRRCLFLRLAGCTLACTWCDTPYTWDWKGRNGARFYPAQEMRLMPVEHIYACLHERGGDFLVVSGGEPMLQQARLVPLLRRLTADRWRIEVETAGVRPPFDAMAEVVTQFNVSPKLSSSGNARARRLNPDAIRSLQATGKAIWKFVAADTHDLDEVAEFEDAYDLKPIYIMPQGVSGEAIIDIARALSAQILRRGWSLTLRTHVLIYGDRRGV